MSAGDFVTLDLGVHPHGRRYREQRSANAQLTLKDIDAVVIGNMEARKLPLVIVANKMDLPNASPARIKTAFPQHPMVPISALEGSNIDSLYQEIAAHFG